MGRLAFFVDGFNLYHSLNDEPRYHKYKWLNLKRLAELLIPPNDKLVKTTYFTTYATWDAAKMERHREYVRILESAGVDVVLGAFRRVDKTCRNCRKKYQTFEEKQTDVNIAISLFETAVMDIWDTAVIISGDSDLIPAIKAVRETFPAKKTGIVIPIGRRAEELKQVADFHIKLKEKHLASCQFPDVVKIDNQQFVRPERWR